MRRISKRPTSSRIETFRRVLERRGIAVSLRASRGLDQNGPVDNCGGNTSDSWWQNQIHCNC